MSLLIRPDNRGVGRFEYLPPQIEFANAECTLVRVTRELGYIDHAGRRWPIPLGLVADGMSDPKPAWSIVGAPIGGKHFAPALNHDARYRLGDCSKEEADLLLWDGLLCCGVDETTAAIITEAVATCGREAWEGNASKRAACGSDLARLLAWA